MPGMMDTVLNVGLCEATVRGLLRLTGNPRLVRDCLPATDRVLRRDRSRPYDRTVRPPGHSAVAAAGVATRQELDFRALRALAGRELELYATAAGQAFPQAPLEQLEQAVTAVLRSWDSAKARWYRAAHGIDGALGTAVTVQRMVFGNAGGTSGAGVGFTRDPATGAAELYVDYAVECAG